MTQLATSDKPVARAESPTQQRATFRFAYLALGVALALCGVLLFAARPWVLWAYNVYQAQRAMTDGLSWPSPHYVDSLPTATNQTGLGRALAHLGAATRWRPQDAFAHQLAGQVYAAQQQWPQAAYEWDQARSLAPRDPLATWHSALAYEQMWLRTRTAPRETLMPDLASQPIDAPDTPIDTVYCRRNLPQTCYVDLDRYTQSFAALPSGPELSADVLFMHPPAAVKLPYTIAPERTGLQFWLGMDPGIRDWPTDGVTYEVWIMPARQPAARIFQHTLDADTARRGWVPAFVDLAPWAGQNVTLELRTTGGPDGNTANDWFGWGNVSVTTSQAASDSVYMPEARIQQLWQAMQLGADDFIARGDEALRTGDYQQANRFYRRARLVEFVPAPLLFRHAIVAAVSGDSDADALVQAVREQDPSFTVAPVTDSLRIDGAALRWFATLPGSGVWPGSAIAPAGEDGAGMLSWSGEAVAVVDIQKSGMYRLRLNAQHTAPAPIELSFGVDGRQFQPVVLSRGDGYTEDSELMVELTQGIHTINVRYENDATVNGLDRNALVLALELHKQ